MQGTLIEKDGLDWKFLGLKLRNCKTKTNRDSMCLECWKVLTYH